MKEIQSTKAKKHLGQNFLMNEKVIDMIVDSNQLTEDDFVLEIGPGTGNLTRRILKKTKKYLGIEKDETLRKKLTNYNIEYTDALEFDKAKLPKTYKIIANIPYYITSPLINYYLKNSFINQHPIPEKLTLMVQKEVAEKIIDHKKKSVLSLQVQAFADVKLLCNVPKEDFSPIPKVDSAVIVIEPYKTWKFKTEITHFFKCLNILFASKRKTIKNNLKPFKKTLKLNDVILKYESRRAESLNLEELDELIYNLKI